MSLVDRVNDELKQAMRARESARLDALRALRGEIIKLAKSGSDVVITDDDVVRLVKGQIKQRQDAIEMFEKGGRNDLVEKEQGQIEVLASYLPPALTEEEIASLIDQAIASAGAAAMKDMGQVMKTVQRLIRESGKDADNRLVAQLVKGKLTN